MRVIIRDNADAASQYVANYIIKRIGDFAPTPSRPFVLGLPTGSSPEKVYQRLVQAHKEGKVSFANVKTFNMDEYVGLPEEHPESYHSFTYRHFFAHIDIDPANVNILNGNAHDLEAECIDYERRIQEAGGIDLFLGGLGPDGHIAFNEPGSSLRSRTRVKTLADDTIRANSRFFGDSLSQVPKQALTVGVGTVNDAREVLLIVLGANKAVALAKTIEGSVSQMWTASYLQMHQNAMIVCDDAATDELLVKTVKYFKSIDAPKRTTIATALPSTDTTEKVQKWRGALKELRVDTKKEPSAAAADGELTPDSMSSRLIDSAIGMSPPRLVSEDKLMDGYMDRMSSRVSTMDF
ncbi:hypothetical protein DV736_g436, partial [Chaetothyriales sp. CBS 134916]